MKKRILLLLLLFSLSGGCFAPLAMTAFAQPVKIVNLQLSNNELTFDVSWGASSRASLWSDSVWVFVDYYDMASGEMYRLPIASAVKTGGAGWGSSATVSMNEGTNAGFHVIGKAKSSGAGTVTVKLTAANGVAIERPCVYATDYPPVLTYATSSGSNTISITGTNPFCGTITDSITSKPFPSTLSPFTLDPGYFVAGYTDATGNEGVIQCGPTAQHTIALTSAANTQNQTLCAGSAIMPTSYTIGGSASSVTMNNLPNGLNVSWSQALKVLTISGTPSASGTYTITTTGPLPECTPKSITGSVIRYALPTVSVTATAQTICYNASPATLTATPAGGNGAVSSYAWQRSIDGTTWNTIAGATANTYSAGASSVTAYYKAMVTMATTGCVSVYSTPSTVTVYNALNGGTISSNQTLCSGASLNAITVSAPSGGSGSYAYLWYKNDTSTGVTTANYTPTDNTNTAAYTRVVTDASCGAATTTGSHVVAINALPTASVAALSINCNEAAAMSATVDAGSGNISSIEWFLGGVSQGTTTDTTKATAALTATTSYYVTTTNTNGCTVTSTTAAITVGSCGQPPSVVIAGYTWSSYNVSTTSGVFTDNPQDYGGYYVWGTNPCPGGWSVPSRDQIKALLAAGNSWDTYNGVNGRWYGKSAGCDLQTCIFLPAAGSNNSSWDKGVKGGYWTLDDAPPFGYCLTLDSDGSSTYMKAKTAQLSVRCVK